MPGPEFATPRGWGEEEILMCTFTKILFSPTNPKQNAMQCDCQSKDEACIFIEVWLIHNIVLVSGVQQSDSAIYFSDYFPL